MSSETSDEEVELLARRAFNEHVRVKLTSPYRCAIEDRDGWTLLSMYEAVRCAAELRARSKGQP